MKTVAVVILNWNGVAWLQKFLPDVVKFSALPNAKVVVVDNASTDNSVDYVKSTFPNVELVINATNGGYAKGYNDGLKHVFADYFILLNSDVLVTENWLQPLLDIMNSNEHIAACQPKILAYNTHSKFEYAGAAGGFIDKFGYAFCRGRFFDFIEDDHKQYEVPTEIFWATGACLLVRSKLFFDSGGLDEDFFAHQEEIDLCWRMKNAGHKIYYVPNSSVYHVGGGTLNALSPFKTYLNFRNNLFLLYKNLPPKYLYRTISFRFILDYLAVARFVISLQTNHASAVIKAHYHFFKSFALMRAKRKKVFFAPDADYTSCVYLGSIVLEYFMGNKKKFEQLNKTKFS
jgi:GT2 family glycosyltransferase